MQMHSYSVEIVCMSYLDCLYLPCGGAMSSVLSVQSHKMGLNQLYLILILVISLAYRTNAQVCCGVSSANLVIQFSTFFCTSVCLPVCLPARPWHSS